MTKVSKLLNTLSSNPSRRAKLKSALTLPTLSFLLSSGTAYAADVKNKSGTDKPEVSDMPQKLMQFVVNTKNNYIPAVYYENE